MTHIADWILAGWLGVLSYVYVRHMRADELRWKRIMAMVDRIDAQLDELS